MKLRSGNGLATASFLLFAVLLVFTGGTAPVRAESTDFDRLEPVPWAQRGIQMEDVDPLPALFSVGGWTQIEKSPVVLSRNGGAIAEQIGVRSRWQLRLMGAVNVLNRVEFGLELPISLLSRQKFNESLQNRILFNDLTLRAKAPIWHWTRGAHRIGVGAGASLRFPTGDNGAFQGSSGRFAQPTLKALSQYEHRRLTARLMLGWAERDRTVLPEWRFQMDDQLLYRLGAAVDVREGRTAIFELAGSTLAREAFSNVQHDALELFGGAQIDLARRVRLLPAAGIGLSKAYGVPVFRLMLSAFWMSPRPAFRQRLRIEATDEASGAAVPEANAIVVADAATDVVPLGSDGQGRWRGAPADRLTVRVSANGYLAAETTVEAKGRALNRVQLQLRQQPPSVKLAVGVDTADGQPVTADVLVSGVADDVRWKRTATLETPGASLIDAYAGTVSIVVQAPGYVTVSTTRKLSPGVVEFPVRLEPLPERGAKQDKAAQLARLTVEIADAETGMPVSNVVVEVPEAGIREVVPSGSWRVVLPGGTWRLVLERDGYYPLRVSQTLEPGQRAFQGLSLTPKSEELVVVGQKQIYINEKIYFATGSSRILKQSYGLLDALAKVLNDNAQVKLVRIAGHTDSRGRLDYNMKLSEARARAVYEALVQRGVDPKRLRHVGFGPNQPIADNATPEGRALNRRVEFEILEQTPIEITAVVPSDQALTAPTTTTETLDLPDVAPVLQAPVEEESATEPVAPAQPTVSVAPSGTETAPERAPEEAVAPEGAAGGAGAAAVEPEAAAQPAAPVAPSGAEGAAERAPEEAVAPESAAGEAGAAAVELEAAAQPTEPVAPSGAEGAAELAPEEGVAPEGAAGEAGAAAVEPEAAAQPAAPVAPSDAEGEAELAPEEAVAPEGAAGGAGATAAEPEAAAQPTVPVAPSGAAGTTELAPEEGVAPEGAAELSPEEGVAPEGAAGGAGAAAAEPEAAAQPTVPVAPSGAEGAAELAPEGTAEAATGAAAEAVEGGASAGRGAVGAVGGIARALIPGDQREGEPVSETAPPAEPRVPVDGAEPATATGETAVATPTLAVTSPSAITRAAVAVTATVPMTTPPLVAAVTAPVAPVVVPAPGAPEVPQGRALRRALRRQRRAGQVQAAERWRGREIVGLRVEAADPADHVLPRATVTVNPDRSGDTAIRKRAEEDGAVEVLAPAGPVTIAVSMPGYLPTVTRTVLTRSERIRLHLLPLRATTAPVLDQKAPRIREKQVSGYISLLVTDVTTAAPVSDASGFVAGVTRETADTEGVIHYELPLGTWRIAVVADGYIPSVTTIVVGSPGEHAASVGIVPVPKEGEVVVRGQQVLFGDPVRFRTNSAEIDPGSALLLDQLADKLHQLPETLRIVVRGHTDDRGSKAMNLELSRARAEAVAQALMARGIDAERIRVEAYGDTEPLVPRSDPKSRSLNRRVEIALEASAEQEDAAVDLDAELLADEFAEPETDAPQPATTGASPVTRSSEYQDLIQDLLGIE